MLTIIYICAIIGAVTAPIAFICFWLSTACSTPTFLYTLFGYHAEIIISLFSSVICTACCLLIKRFSKKGVHVDDQDIVDTIKAEERDLFNRFLSFFNGSQDWYDIDDIDEIYEELDGTSTSVLMQPDTVTLDKAGLINRNDSMVTKAAVEQIAIPTPDENPVKEHTDASQIQEEIASVDVPAIAADNVPLVKAETNVAKDIHPQKKKAIIPTIKPTESSRKLDAKEIAEKIKRMAPMESAEYLLRAARIPEQFYCIGKSKMGAVCLKSIGAKNWITYNMKENGMSDVKIYSDENAASKDFVKIVIQRYKADKVA